MTVEETLIADLNGRGYRLSSLYQRDDGSWQSHARHRAEFWVDISAGGASMVEALGKLVESCKPIVGVLKADEAALI